MGREMHQRDQLETAQEYLVCALHNDYSAHHKKVDRRKKGMRYKRCDQSAQSGDNAHFSRKKIVE